MHLQEIFEALPSTACGLCTCKVWSCYCQWLRRCNARKIHNYYTLGSRSHKMLPSTLDFMWPMYRQSSMLLNPMVKEKMHLQENTFFEGHSKCCQVPSTCWDLCTCKVWSCYGQWLRRCNTRKLHYYYTLGSHKMLPGQYPRLHVTYTLAKFDIATSHGYKEDAFTRKYIIWPWPSGTLFNLWPWPWVKVTRNVFQYPLHCVTYSATTFEVATSNILLRRRYIYKKRDERTHGRTDGWTDGRKTDRLWYEINIPFFLKKKASIIVEWKYNEIKWLKINIKSLRNTSFNLQKCHYRRRQRHINKKVEYTGLELTSRCSVSSIRLLCNQLRHCGLRHENTEITTVLNNCFQIKLYQINLCFKMEWSDPKVIVHRSEVVVDLVVCLFIYCCTFSLVLNMIFTMTLK